MQEPCTHNCGFEDVFFYPCINEEGWRCAGCKHEFGFNPELDRRRTYFKVWGLLHDMHQAKIVYVSNGTHGEMVAEQVAARCHEENRYDQTSIVQFIIENPNMATDGKFWQEQARRWFAEQEGNGDGQIAMQDAAARGETARLL